MRLTVYTWICLFILGFHAISCGNKNVSIQSANSSVLDSNIKEELFVWMDHAWIYENTDMRSGLIAEVKAGEKLALTGETSATKVKVNLRGVDFEDVWVKVKTTDGKEGWIFKGMLTSDEARANNMNDFTIVPGTRVGKVQLTGKKEDVEKIYGKEFVKEGEIFFPEGMSAKGFYVFKDSPLELQCVTNEKTGAIQTILIRQPNAAWSTAEGVKIGTLLDDLVKMNSKPITFNGFGWDYGGTVSSFNKGNLSIYENNLGLSLGEPDNLAGLDEFMGDNDCSTANRKILGKGVKVAEISVFEGAVM
jgi:hypothetical protein